MPFILHFIQLLIVRCTSVIDICHAYNIDMNNRYNIFYQVQKGLRALLYETALRLQQTDFSNPENASKNLDELNAAVNLFTAHLYVEEQYSLRAIQHHAGLIFEDIKSEHRRTESTLMQLSGLMQAFQHAVTTDEKTEIGSVISSAFASFVSFMLDSMCRKENALNKLLWKNFTDEELMNISITISTGLRSDISGMYGKWILRGMNTLEVIEWLKCIRYTAPDQTFNALLEIAEAEISSDRWLFIQESITEGAMLA